MFNDDKNTIKSFDNAPITLDENLQSLKKWSTNLQQKFSVDMEKVKKEREFRRSFINVKYVPCN